MIVFQELLRRLLLFWEEQGCVIHQGYDLEVGAGTLNPTTFLRCLGPEPFHAAYIEPCRRPADGRYGENPNRVQHYFQFQTILKPSPLNMQTLYLNSLRAIGVDLAEHDIRFVHDDWENPTIGAWGLGWEVWLDGMEVTQYTYFQSVGGLPLDPVSGELTYGLERLAMYLQKVDNIFDLQWNDKLTYGDIYLSSEREWSRYNFEEASVEMWGRQFKDFEKESKRMISLGLPLPAYEFVMKSSHAFNILDARGVISVSERTSYISRIRDLARAVAEQYLEKRKEAGYPLKDSFLIPPVQTPEIPEIPAALLGYSEGRKADFLLEIGSEELPATFVPIGLRSLEQLMKELLEKEQIPFRSIRTYGTPRRLAIQVKEMALGIPVQTMERKGPALEQAFEKDGSLSAIGQGFLRSLDKPQLTLREIQSGQHPALTIRKIKDREHLFAILQSPSKAAAQVLSEKLPELIQNIDFPKKMHWSGLHILYARPLRWITALLGEEVVPFAVANIVSGRVSWGHAQLDNGPFTVPAASEWLSLLLEHKVLADPQERTKNILEQADAIEKQLHVKIINREQVLPQVVYLTEWPQLISASFAEHYLKVPKEVLISEMVEHQKYFPVAQEDGTLCNLFIITADNNPSEQIISGNQKVLSARLSDGVFLYEKSVKVPLNNYTEKLKHITYLSGLGSLNDKQLRIQGHMDVLQRFLHVGEQAKSCRAAQICKADLASEMVIEFPKLQGVMGHCYAREQGEHEEVALAIEEQWMPLGENSPLPKSITGALLSLADKFDNIISCFTAGLKPTSSSDPYALRRQTIGIIKILIEHKWRLPLMETLFQCCNNFVPSQMKHPEKITPEILTFFQNRVRTVFVEYGLEKDEIEATLSHGLDDIYDSFCRICALHQFRLESDSFAQLYEVFKRAKGQLSQQAAQKLLPDLLIEEAEIGLNKELDNVAAQFQHGLAEHDYSKAYSTLAKLQPPLSRLFDEVKILADEEQLRNNRIALLQRVFSLFSKLLDFSKIQGH